ncbi:MAG: KH domain-containing protein [Coriobacteriia bacterium]|nr:KH domain-containing protein [Coriobacteriia bacterium]
MTEEIIPNEEALVVEDVDVEVPAGDEESAEVVEVADSVETAEAEIAPKAEERSPVDETSDEDIDALADAAIATINEVLEFFPVEKFTIEEYEGDEGELILDIVGEELNILIGRHGRTAEALQVVVSAISSRKCNVFYPITVDVEGYKHRRKQRVIEIAQRVVERVRESGHPVSLKPMTPAERRQVHMALREVRGVTTTSEGSGSYRHVVVLPVE